MSKQRYGVFRYGDHGSFFYGEGGKRQYIPVGLHNGKYPEELIGNGYSTWTFIVFCAYEQNTRFVMIRQIVSKSADASHALPGASPEKLFFRLI
jgi:hypothetical protein